MRPILVIVFLILFTSCELPTAADLEQKYLEERDGENENKDPREHKERDISDCILPDTPVGVCAIEYGGPCGGEGYCNGEGLFMLDKEKENIIIRIKNSSNHNELEVILDDFQGRDDLEVIRVISSEVATFVPENLAFCIRPNLEQAEQRDRLFNELQQLKSVYDIDCLMLESTTLCPK